MHKRIRKFRVLWIFLIAVAIVAVLPQAYIHLSNKHLFAAESLSSIDNSAKSIIRISASERTLARKFHSNFDDEIALEKILEGKYLNATFVKIKDCVYLDIVPREKERTIIIIGQSQPLQKYTLINGQVYFNKNNRAIEVVCEASVEDNLIVDSEINSVIRPFQNNPNCLESYADRNLSTIIESVYALESSEYSPEQEIRVYETQNQFITTEERWLHYPVGTNLAVIALQQQADIVSMLQWIENQNDNMTTEGTFSDEVFFCTYARQEFFHKRFVTITNPIPPYHGCEVIVFETTDTGEIEVKYQTPLFINKSRDVVSTNFIREPSSAKQCDDYYRSQALGNFNVMLQNGEKFTTWEEN